MNRIAQKGTVIGAVLAITGALFVGTASAGGATVTRGDFSVFAAGSSLGYEDLAGHAQMIRTASGSTIVRVHVTGLQPDTTYGSHVHAAPCGVGDADGHYKDDPNGPATPPNELWPGFTSDADGIGNGGDKASWTARETAVSVVVHAPGGAKIGCADLA